MTLTQMLDTAKILREVAGFYGRDDPANWIVLAHGCFDPLTVGHVRHLKAASELGGHLFVTVTPDVEVFKQKGRGRPVVYEAQRVEMLEALLVVSNAAVNDGPDVVETILRLQPDIYVKGGEYKGRMTPALEKEKAAVESYGGKLVFTDTEEYHSSQLIEATRK